jgi:hypothetical protein
MKQSGVLVTFCKFILEMPVSILAGLPAILKFLCLSAVSPGLWLMVHTVK